MISIQYSENCLIQALLNIQDDFEDIEDLPNIFVIAAIDNIPYTRIKNLGMI
jgi:hypothetical protein